MLLPILLLYLVVVNLVTYYLYWSDKRASIAKSWRVPEHVLLCAGFMGGTPAAILAQRRLRHKTKKGKFQFRFWSLTVIQGCMIVFLPAPILYAL
jgi:uncharacterized membrane protein YsdA (DUF1294 family)